MRTPRWVTRCTGTFSTHSLLCLPLVGLHFGLQLVHQVLKPEDVLTILLSLQKRASITETSSPRLPLLGSPPYSSTRGLAARYLVSHLFDFAFIFVGPLQSLSPSLLLSIQFIFQLPHLCGAKSIRSEVKATYQLSLGDSYASHPKVTLRPCCVLQRCLLPGPVPVVTLYR